MRRFLMAAMLFSAVGCQTGGARYVSQKAREGVVAIPSNSPSERDKALTLIARHVGPQFVIDKEEVVQHSGFTEKDRLLRMNPNNLFGKDTMPTEHRIHYHRSPAAASMDGGVVQASAVAPREAVSMPGGVRSFLPLTCEGCQGR